MIASLTCTAIFPLPLVVVMFADVELALCFKLIWMGGIAAAGWVVARNAYLSFWVQISSLRIWGKRALGWKKIIFGMRASMPWLPGTNCKQ